MVSTTELLAELSARLNDAEREAARAETALAQANRERDGLFHAYYTLREVYDKEGTDGRT